MPGALRLWILGTGLVAMTLAVGCWSSEDKDASGTGQTNPPAGADPAMAPAPPRLEMPEGLGVSPPPAPGATEPASQTPEPAETGETGRTPPVLRENPLRREENRPSPSGNPYLEPHPTTPGEPPSVNDPTLAPPSVSDPTLAPPSVSDPTLAPPAASDPFQMAAQGMSGAPSAAGSVPPSGMPSPPAGPVPPAGPSEPRSGPAEPTGKDPAEPKFDPIKENGPIFVGWPTPRLAIVVTGREDGYMEPCGCAGLDRMKGGLSRRHTMIESLRRQGWPVVCVDAGGLSKGYGRQTEIKFYFTTSAMSQMGYDAIGFGQNDLRLPATELVAAAADPSPFVSANVGLLGFDAQLTARSRIVERNGIKVGITSVLGKSLHDQINNQEIELADPAKAIAEVLPELRQKCNLLILLAFATKEESIALGQQFPDFGLVVTSGGSSEPPAAPERIEGTRSLLIEVGEKGMDAVVLGLYDDPKLPLRYQRVPLDSRFPASAEMKRIMVAYQDRLRAAGLGGLAVRPVAHPQFDTNGGFVGSAKCKDCHEESYAVWKKSGHAKAWQTLKATDPPRDADPECISCHVIGWHPTKYFPYKTGFESESGTPHLVDVGCEACHGPGAAHVAAESGGDLALQEKYQKAMVVTKAESQNDHAKWCQNCHDLDNSPEFNFETYWPKVEHYEDVENDQ